MLKDIDMLKALPSPSVDDSGVNALKFQCSDGTKALQQKHTFARLTVKSRQSAENDEKI